MKKFLAQFVPPIVSRGLEKIRPVPQIEPKQYHPTWHTMNAGRLKGRDFLIDPVDNLWQAEILEGTFDGFMFDYLKNVPLKGKTVLDVGAHIGYHTLMFADMVGDEGKVYAFEPNQINRERLQANLGKNPDLARRVEVLDIALSDKDGEQEFNFSPDIENGQSSGSYLSGAHTPFTPEEYQAMDFQKTTVRTVRVDNLGDALGQPVRPDVLKIDVEGAEWLVLGGAGRVLAEDKPLLLVEVHSIYNMYRLAEIFANVHYEMELIKEEKDGRCFFACRSQEQTK